MELYHYNIKGSHWGVRRYQNEDGSLTPLGKIHYGIGQAREARREASMQKRDLKWVRKHEDKIYKQTYKKVQGEAKNYLTGELANKYRGNIRNAKGQLNNSLVSDYNKRLADLMNKAVGDIPAPSGKVVRYVAKRREMGVYTALADTGYDMGQVKNGVWGNGRIAYKSSSVRTT